MMSDDVALKTVPEHLAAMEQQRWLGRSLTLPLGVFCGWGFAALDFAPVGVGLRVVTQRRLGRSLALPLWVFCGVVLC
jgi:hypothetical protein